MSVGVRLSVKLIILTHYEKPHPNILFYFLELFKPKLLAIILADSCWHNIYAINAMENFHWTS